MNDTWIRLLKIAILLVLAPFAFQLIVATVMLVYTGCAWIIKTMKGE